MAYTKTNWVDGPAAGPSINAANLGKIENQLADLDARLTTVASDSAAAKSLANSALPKVDAARDYLSKTEASTMYALATLLDRLVPIGSVMPWLASSPPTGWIELNGQSLSRSVYPRLFALWGTTFGSDNNSTFKVPDFRGRALFGRAGNGVGAIGATGGEQKHTLSADELPSHSHALTDGLGRYPTLYQTDAGSGGKWEMFTWASQFNANTTLRVASSGGSQAHNNMPPYLSGMYIARAQ